VKEHALKAFRRAGVPLGAFVKAMWRAKWVCASALWLWESLAIGHGITLEVMLATGALLVAYSRWHYGRADWR